VKLGRPEYPALRLTVKLTARLFGRIRLDTQHCGHESTPNFSFAQTALLIV
jgi:hypothetical protein